MNESLQQLISRFILDVDDTRLESVIINEIKRHNLNLLEIISCLKPLRELFQNIFTDDEKLDNNYREMMVYAKIIFDTLPIKFFNLCFDSIEAHRSFSPGAYEIYPFNGVASYHIPGNQFTYTTYTPTKPSFCTLFDVRIPVQVIAVSPRENDLAFQISKGGGKLTSVISFMTLSLHQYLEKISHPDIGPR